MSQNIAVNWHYIHFPCFKGVSQQPLDKGFYTFSKGPDDSLFRSGKIVPPTIIGGTAWITL